MTLRKAITNPKCPGFTLLELMVAISIFAIVSLLTMGGMTTVLDTQQHTEEHLQRLTRLQMVFTILSRELQQFSPRSIRDEYGAVIESISSETSEGVSGIEFSHQGRFTLGSKVSLQRVAYYFEDEQLVKKVWRVLDRVEDTSPVKQVLLDNIEELNFSFYVAQLQDEGNWQDTWTEDENAQLRAVKLSLKMADYDEIYRIFPINN